MVRRGLLGRSSYAYAVRRTDLCSRRRIMSCDGRSQGGEKEVADVGDGRWAMIKEGQKRKKEKNGYRR